MTKPPVGVKPRHLHEWERAVELCRGIHEYSDYMRFLEPREDNARWRSVASDSLSEWVAELRYLLKDDAARNTQKTMG